MNTFWVICAVIVVVYFAIWNYIKATVWCKSQTCLVGKTAIVTGANSGIGFATALDFAKRGARVILACRDKNKAEDAKQKIIEETNNKNVVVKIINLASFDSVRNFVKDIKASEERLDILVNNAGLGGIGNDKSDDGLLLVMQVNYLSSFLLTYLLIGLLIKTGPSRVINVSSSAARFAKFDIDQFNTYTGSYTTYANSKLCNILFTLELAERLKETEVSTYSIHPGVVQTEIFRYMEGYAKVIIDAIKEDFFKTCEEGAQTTIYTAVARSIEEFNGLHFENCEVVDIYATADVNDLPKKLWEKSIKFVELKPEEIKY